MGYTNIINIYNEFKFFVNYIYYLIHEFFVLMTAHVKVFI